MAKRSDFRCFDESRTDDQLSEASPNMAPVAMMVDEEPAFRAISMMDFAPKLQVLGGQDVMSKETFPTTMDTKFPLVTFQVPFMKNKETNWTLEEPVTGTISSYGWNLNKVQPAPLPRFFPGDLVKLELPRSEFIPVLERVQTFLRLNSIQASFEDFPASASLQTTDCVEIRIKFWEARTKDYFYVDVQRCRGDHWTCRDVTRRLMDAVKGVAQDEDPKTVPMSVDSAMMLQAMMERLAPVPQPKGPSSVESMINLVHSCLLSRCFSDRTTGLDRLVHFTDMRQSVITDARAGALVVLNGDTGSLAVAGDRDTLNRRCQDIQKVLFQILQNGEFDGDEMLRKSIIGTDYDKVMSSSKTERCLGPYEAAMITCRHKVLAILVNSVEALDPTLKRGEVLQRFLTRCEHFTGKDLYSTLIDSIEQCQDQMAIGYLACKAVRMLVYLLPRLKGQLQMDARAKSCVDKAWHAGRACHCLLETESKMLRDGIMAA